MSLRSRRRPNWRQREFGLRREEAIKLQVGYADCEDTLQRKPHWCTGRRPWEIPILNAAQRELLKRFGSSLGTGGTF